MLAVLSDSMNVTEFADCPDSGPTKLVLTGGWSNVSLPDAMFLATATEQMRDSAAVTFRTCLGQQATDWLRLPDRFPKLNSTVFDSFNYVACAARALVTNVTDKSI